MTTAAHSTVSSLRASARQFASIGVEIDGERAAGLGGGSRRSPFRLWFVRGPCRVMAGAALRGKAGRDGSGSASAPSLEIGEAGDFGLELQVTVPVGP